MFTIPTSVEADGHSQSIEQENEFNNEVINQPLSQTTGKEQLLSSLSPSNYSQAATIKFNDIFNDLENNNSHSELRIHLYQELIEFSNQTMFDFFEVSGQVDTGL